jgi:hypothetical protein
VKVAVPEDRVYFRLPELMDTEVPVPAVMALNWPVDGDVAAYEETVDEEEKSC